MRKDAKMSSPGPLRCTLEEENEALNEEVIYLRGQLRELDLDTNRQLQAQLGKEKERNFQKAKIVTTMRVSTNQLQMIAKDRKEQYNDLSSRFETVKKDNELKTSQNGQLIDQTESLTRELLETKQKLLVEEENTVELRKKYSEEKARADGCALRATAVLESLKNVHKAVERSLTSGDEIG